MMHSTISVRSFFFHLNYHTCLDILLLSYHLIQLFATSQPHPQIGQGTVNGRGPPLIRYVVVFCSAMLETYVFSLASILSPTLVVQRRLSIAP